MPKANFSITIAQILLLLMRLGEIELETEFQNGGKC